jgi:hypothetical protein
MFGCRVTIRCQSGVGIHGAETTACETELSRLALRSAALITGTTSAEMPWDRRTFAVFMAATPSPMWLMFRFAAKFLYARITRFSDKSILLLLIKE